MTLINLGKYEIRRALTYLQQLYPDKNITDELESVRKILDLVEKYIIKIQDPALNNYCLEILPGKNWIKNQTFQEEILTVCYNVHNS